MSMSGEVKKRDALDQKYCRWLCACLDRRLDLENKISLAFILDFCALHDL